MGRDLTHSEASLLLGVLALDALDPVEREEVEQHVAGCGWCHAEVVEHREVAALLVAGPAPAPAGLWERISGALEEAPPPLDLAAVVAMKPRRAAFQRVASVRRDRPGLRVAAIAAMVAVLAGVVGVLGLKVVQDDGGGGSHGQQLAQAVDAAKSDPAAQKVELRSLDGSFYADAWVLPDGRSYLADDNLPTLAADRAYQLWALEGGERVSVGVLGADPGQIAFTANGPVTGLAITEEQAGGVDRTEKQPVVVGLLA